MSLLQNGEDEMDVALKLRLPRPFFQGSTHFKSGAIAPPVIQLFPKIAFGCLYNNLGLSKKVCIISLPQILTDLENR